MEAAIFRKRIFRAEASIKSVVNFRTEVGVKNSELNLERK